MLFDEADEGHLKAWIVKRLADTSDADSDVLADYVLALLRHDSDQATIRSLFESEIPDFLSNDAAAFTDDVFQAINHKSYLPGAPPAPPVTRQPPAPAQTAAQAPKQSQAQNQQSASSKQAAGSKKRRLSDRDEDDVDITLHDTGGRRNGAPVQKQQKRNEGFQGNREAYDGHFGYANVPYGTPQYGNMPNPGQAGRKGQLNANAQAFAPIDTSMILQNIQMLQQLGIPIPDPAALGGPYPGPSKSASRKKRKRCRDYDKKGYCARGSECKFEHGTESVFLPPFIPPTGDVTLDYDPTSAGMPVNLFQGPMNFINGSQNENPTQRDSATATNSRESKKSKKQKGKQQVATVAGPVHDRIRTKIVVQNIPKENLTEDQIRGFFSQFGGISDVTIQEHRRLAVLNFETWDAANAAWSSPKVIFDNRFVKVFWHKDESDNAKGRISGELQAGDLKNDAMATDEPEFDLEEFRQKQAEAQKMHEEKLKRRQELERERQDLEDRRTRHLAEKKELDAKLRSASPATHLERKSSAQTEALRAQLAALEAEADLLGIDPNATSDDAQHWSGYGRGRGGGYRGRGSWRGGYAARGGRGGLGGIEARHAAYAQYSLDLRPKVVIVSGADFTVPSNDECLRQYLFSIGEFESIRAEPEATYITFKDRRTAEQFMAGLASADNTLAGMEDKLELTWGQNSTPASVSGHPAGAAGTAKASDGADNDEDAGSVESGEIQDDDDDMGLDGGHNHQDQGDMDYDAW